MSAAGLEMSQICDCHVRAPGPDEVRGGARIVLIQEADSDDARDAMLGALAARGAVSTRGVAMIGLTTPEATLAQLALSGVCGLRVVLSGADAEGTFNDGVERAARHAWLVQAHGTAETFDRIAPALRAAPVPVVLEGLFGVEPPGSSPFGTVLELLAAGRVWVLLHGAASSCLPAMRAAIATNASQVIWGSHWPHGDPPAAYDMLHTATTNPEVLRRILIDNPATLYGFGDASNAARSR